MFGIGRFIKSTPRRIATFLFGHDRLVERNRTFWKNATYTKLGQDHYYEKIQQELTQLLQQFVSDSSIDAADIGCGNGEFTQLISTFCNRTTGYEFSEELISIAKTQYPLENGDYLPIDLQSTDWVLPSELGLISCMGVTPAIHDDDMIALMFRKFHLSLKNGGILIVRDTLGHERHTKLCTNEYYAVYRDAAAYTEMIESAGFQLEKSVVLFEDLKVISKLQVYSKCIPQSENNKDILTTSPHP